MDKYDDIYESIWDTFSQNDASVRREIQRESGTAQDGIFWPNTFRAIMQKWDNVKDYFSAEVLESENSPEEDIIPQDTQEIHDVEVGSSREEDIDENHDTWDYPWEIQVVPYGQNEWISEVMSYQDFRREIHKLSKADIRKFQAVIWTGVDGIPGPKTYDAWLWSWLTQVDFQTIVRFENIGTIEKKLWSIRDDFILSDTIFSQIPQKYAYYIYSPQESMMYFYEWDGKEGEVMDLKILWIRILKGILDFKLYDTIVEKLENVRSHSLRIEYIDNLQNHDNWDIDSPEYQEFMKKLEILAIIKDIPPDGPLPRELSLSKQRENYREQFWELEDFLSSSLNIPQWLISAIIRKETTFVQNLNSPTWSKWIMQLTIWPFKDMNGDVWSRIWADNKRILQYQNLFQKINLSILSGIKVWEFTVWERMKPEILQAFDDLQNGSIQEYRQALSLLRQHIKWRERTKIYDHVTNMIIGSVYFAFLHQIRTWWNLRRAVRDYNWDRNIHQKTWKETREHYADTVLNFHKIEQNTRTLQNNT